jgi:hypothetical protein
VSSGCRHALRRALCHQILRRHLSYRDRPLTRRRCGGRRPVRRPLALVLSRSSSRRGQGSGGGRSEGARMERARAEHGARAWASEQGPSACEPSARAPSERAPSERAPSEHALSDRGRAAPGCAGLCAALGALSNQWLKVAAGPLCRMDMPEGRARQALHVCCVAMACKMSVCDASGASRAGVHTVIVASSNTF